MSDEVRARALLVEDNPANVRLAQEAVKRAEVSLDFDVVEDGEKALNHLTQRTERGGVDLPDLILLDLNLPGIDGREVLKQVKSDDRLKHIPVIVMTTSESEEDVQRCYELHANGYVTKPLGLRNLGKAFQVIHDFWFSVASVPRMAI